MRTIRSNSAGSLGSTGGVNERSGGVATRSPGYASISSANRCQPQFRAAAACCLCFATAFCLYFTFRCACFAAVRLTLSLTHSRPGSASSQSSLTSQPMSTPRE